MLGRLGTGITRWKSWWTTAPLVRRARKVALAAALLAGCWYFAGVVDKHPPIRSWLFPVYVGYWLLTLLFNAGDVVNITDPAANYTSAVVGNTTTYTIYDDASHTNVVAHLAQVA